MVVARPLKQPGTIFSNPMIVPLQASDGGGWTTQAARYNFLQSDDSATTSISKGESTKDHFPTTSHSIPKMALGRQNFINPPGSLQANLFAVPPFSNQIRRSHLKQSSTKSIHHKNFLQDLTFGKIKARSIYELPPGRSSSKSKPEDQFNSPYPQANTIPIGGESSSTPLKRIEELLHK